jgi:hypothetical protein
MEKCQDITGFIKDKLTFLLIFSTAQVKLNYADICTA